jgi:hypothetical protein
MAKSPTKIKLNFFKAHPKVNLGKNPFQCGMEGAECGMVEQQSNEGTKFYRLGCLVPWLFKKLQDGMRRSTSVSVIAKHRAPSHMPRCYCGIRNGI